MRLVIEIKTVGDQLFELDFRDFEARTVSMLTAATLTAPFAAGTRATVAAVALRTVAAFTTAIFPIGRSASGTRATVSTLRTVSLRPCLARRTVTLGARGPLAFGPGLLRLPAIGPRFLFWSCLRFRFELQVSESSGESVRERCPGVSHRRFSRCLRLVLDRGFYLGLNRSRFDLIFDCLCILFFGHS
jgi:hypothetical protein